ncbi:MAG: cyclic nucleotide-binding domain-containing protein [Betaproteobacteria bacterium]|nr:cyclic nucleotide-binding domain-containing protein [Betaproteobacteria bacterium]
MAEFHDNDLFRGVDPEAARALLPLAEPVAFLKGSRIARQNELARGAWLIRAGSAEVRVALPAGGERVMATLAPGSAFGESALFETGVCNASVYALTHVDGWLLPGEAFRALAFARNAAALTIQRNITATLVARLSALNTELARQVAPEDRATPAPPPAADPLAAYPRLTRADFDFRAFLKLLPFFAGFTPSDIEAVTAGTRALEVKRGAWLFASGQAAHACFLVVRGAVEAVRSIGSPGTLERRIAILPPGALAGYLSLLAGKPAHGAHARAREDSLLLEFPAALFMEHYRGDSGAQIKFQHAIHRALLTSLARSNSQMARLVTQAALTAAQPFRV